MIAGSATSLSLGASAGILIYSSAIKVCIITIRGIWLYYKDPFHSSSYWRCISQLMIKYTYQAVVLCLSHNDSYRPSVDDFCHISQTLKIKLNKTGHYSKLCPRYH